MTFSEYRQMQLRLAEHERSPRRRLRLLLSAGITWRQLCALENTDTRGLRARIKSVFSAS